MPATKRATLATLTSIDGIGLHSGVNTRVWLLPAPAGQGVVFERADLAAPYNSVPALARFSRPAPLHTRLVSDTGASVATIEHLMAALHALGITDLTVRVSREELPILDGSAGPWMRLLRAAGVKRLDANAPLLSVLRTVRVERGGAWAQLSPNALGKKGLRLSCAIDFADDAIGHQTFAMTLSATSFSSALQNARTFCQAADIDAMRAKGLALGGSVECAVVFDNGVVRNPEGLRYANEPVRHKMLDAVGDLYLAGAFLNATFEANRPGHALTTALLRALLSDPANFVQAAAQANKILLPA